MSKRLKWFTQAALPAILLAVSGAAHATYAVSYNTISNFDLDFTGGAGSLMPFTFSNDVAAQGIISAASFNGTDAAATCVGAFCSAFNNSFTAHGAGGDYAYGDALIASSNVLGGLGSASSIGEISAGAAGFASGSNSMVAFFSVLSGTTGTVAFSFKALPYMQVTPGVGNAVSAMSITISGASGQVFSWTPDGSVGTGITGGAETLDALNLNLGIGPGGTYNPTIGSFAAQTNSLANGSYTLNISMTNQVSAVPEASTYAMMLAGLGLVGFMARRRSLVSA